MWSTRLLAACGIAAFMGMITGCYTYPVRPLAQIAPVGEVSAEINDVGRVALAEPVGSGVARIDGEVTQKADTSIRLMVTEVRFLNGTSTKWQGQELTLRTQDMQSLSQRTFSKQRTIAAGVLGVLSAAALFTVGFTGLFNGDPNRDKTVEPPPGS